MKSYNVWVLYDNGHMTHIVARTFNKKRGLGAWSRLTIEALGRMYNVPVRFKA